MSVPTTMVTIITMMTATTTTAPTTTQMCGTARGFITAIGTAATEIGVIEGITIGLIMAAIGMAAAGTGTAAADMVMAAAATTIRKML